MAYWIREATAATLSVGICTDGSGIRLGSLNIIRGEMQLSKAGGAYATISGVATAYPDKNGNYFVGFDTTDTNTRGRLRLDITNANRLPIPEDFMVVPTQAYDSLFAGDRWQTDLREFGDAALDFTSTMKGIMGSVGVVGSVGFVSDGMIGTVGYARALGSIAAGIVGTIPFAQQVGTVAHVSAIGDKTNYSLVADQTAVRIGTVTHVADGLIGTVTFTRGGVIGSVGFVSDGLIGTLGYAMALGSMTAGIVGTIAHCSQVGTLLGLAAAAQNNIADALLKRDIDQVEATAAIHSLCTAVLKAVSKIKDNAGTLEIYRTDGATLQASQVLSTDAAADPIIQQGVST